MPQTKLAELKEELENIERDKREIYKRRRIEDWIDSSYGCCALSNPKMDEMIEKALFYFAGIRYDLVCWCIMPNHVHVMIAEKSNLSKIVQSWKSYTDHWAWTNLSEEWLPDRGTGDFWERRDPDLRAKDNVRKRKAGAFRSQRCS